MFTNAIYCCTPTIHQYITCCECEADRRVDPYEPNRVWFTTRVTATHTGTLKFGGSEYKATGRTVQVRVVRALCLLRIHPGSRDVEFG